MTEKRRDSKGRILRSGEVQRPDGKIRINEAENTTVDDLFRRFMDIRKDLKESTRCCYNDIYVKHIKPVIGQRPIGTIKPTGIQKLYQSMSGNGGVSPTTVQKAHSILYQPFGNAVMDNILRTNPVSNAFNNFRKTAELSPACREPLTTGQQAVFIGLHLRLYPGYNDVLQP